jgi:tetratricopeptide (TPR) repeat protein
MKLAEFQPQELMSRIIFIIAAAGILLLAACSTTPRTREAKHIARGRQFADRKEYRKAIIEFKVAAQNMPRDAEPVFQLGMAYLRVGAARLAVESFLQALSLNPKHEGAQFQMALVKVGSDNPELVLESKQVLTAFLAGATHANDADAMGALALAEAKLGNKSAMLDLLEKAVRKAPANLRPAAVIIGLYTAQGDTDTAEKVARDLTGRLPDSPDAAVLRAQVSLGMQDTADADAQIRRALALNRNFRPALQLRLRRELMNENRASAEETTRELSKLSDNETWGTYARLLFGEGKIDEGIAEYNRVLKEHGDAPDLRDDYSRLLIDAKRDAEAEAAIAVTLAKNPKDIAALLQRVTVEIDRRNLIAAAADIKALQNAQSFSAELTYQQSRLFGARGEIVRQGDLLTQTLQANPRMLKARLDLSGVLVAAGQVKLALETLEQADANAKRTANYVYHHNMALIAAGNYEEARRGVSAGLAQSRSPRFLCQDAMLRLRSQDLAGARQSLESAFQLAPADPGTLNLLGEVMKRQNEGARYIAMVRDAAAKNPKASLLQNMLGRQLETLGDLNGARTAFEAQRAAGDAAGADEAIAYLDMRAGALEQASQRLRGLVKTHDSAVARLMLAEIETRRNAPAGLVASHYLKALQLEPANVPAMNNLAELFASRQGKYEDALFWAEKALALAPNNPAVEDTIGWIYFRQGKFDTALSFLEKSLKESDQPLVHYHLAGALLAIGDWSRGRKEYQTALRMDPDSEFRAVIAPLFESHVAK